MENWEREGVEIAFGEEKWVFLLAQERNVSWTMLKEGIDSQLKSMHPLLLEEMRKGTRKYGLDTLKE